MIKRTLGSVFLLGLAVILTARPAGAQTELDDGPPEASPRVYDRPWWEELQDEALVDLLRSAAVANGDLGAAVARIVQAEAASTRSRSALLPTLSLDGQASTGPLEGLGFQFGLQRDDGGSASSPTLFYSGSANVTARYRLSSWGSDRRVYQASRLEEMANRGDEDGVALSLVSQVAEAYYDAVSAAQQRAVIERQLEATQQLTDLTQLRYQRGEATALEVLQQRQQLATTRSNLPPARADLRLSQARLEALLGQMPGTTGLGVGGELPEVPQEGTAMVAFDPMGRPDVRGAEARVEAAGFQSSSARWSNLPTIDLSANSGSQFFRSVGTTTQSTWGAAVAVSFPLLDGFDRSGRIREATASERAARASLDQLKLNAAAEMVTAGIQREEQQAQLDALREQFTASQRAYDESRRRYLSGLATVLDVLNALNGMQQAELGVIRTHRTALASWIQHRQAAGGPWTRGLRLRLLGSS